jgi:hypothetical protein
MLAVLQTPKHFGKAMLFRLNQIVIVGLGVFVAGACPMLAQSPAASNPAASIPQRSYEAGPLGPGDFQAAVPEDDQGLDALTTTDLRYRYRYETRSAGHRASAWVTQFEVEAVMIPRESWNRHPENLTLMDHEQGHFDLAQISALRARLHFAPQRIVSNAATVEQAVSNVENEIQQQMEKFFEELRRQNQEYDRLTDHGRRDASQREQRRHQQQQLADLIQQWQSMRETASDASRNRSKSAGTRP